MMNVMKRYTLPRGFTVAPAIGLALVIATGLAGVAQADDADRIQPYRANPFDWQYNGKPVVLLGGSDEDNPFQGLVALTRRVSKWGGCSSRATTLSSGSRNPAAWSQRSRSDSANPSQ
jgi:hypothetical protein